MKALEKGTIPFRKIGEWKICIIKANVVRPPDRCIREEVTDVGQRIGVETVIGKDKAFVLPETWQ